MFIPMLHKMNEIQLWDCRCTVAIKHNRHVINFLPGDGTRTRRNLLKVIFKNKNNILLNFTFSPKLQEHFGYVMYIIRMSLGIFLSRCKRRSNRSI
jgi:hypothetical protein